MPRVGSSRIKTAGGSPASATAAPSAGCRRRAALSAARRGANPQLADKALGDIRLLAFADGTQPAALSLQSEDNVFTYRGGADDAVGFAIFRAETHAKPRRLRRAADGPLLPRIMAVPLSARRTPNSTSAVSVRPEPSRPASPTASPGRTAAERFDGALLAVVLKLHHRLIAFQRSAGALQRGLHQFAPQHQLDQLQLRQRVGIAGGDILAVAKDSDAIADAVHRSRKWVTKIRLIPFAFS